MSQLCELPAKPRAQFGEYQESQPKRMHVARLGGRRGSLRAALTPALPIQPRAKSSIAGETEARRATESKSAFGKYNRCHCCYCTSCMQLSTILQQAHKETLSRVDVQTVPPSPMERSVVGGFGSLPPWHPSPESDC